MKIIIIGAGHGGLQAAKVLCENGYDVTVFEKQSRNLLGYDWCDDVEPSVFEELSIPIPEGSSRPDEISFVAPYSTKPLFVPSEESSREYHIDRRDFLSVLVEKAENVGCKIDFNKKVDSLLIKDNGIYGVVCENENFYCDLVIDSSGISSPFRAQLPENYHITSTLNESEYFSVYRAFYDAKENIPFPEKHRKKLYLKHLGEKGISWCICEKNDMINVLVGRAGELSKETLENALKELRKDNPIIGDVILRGGCEGKIPIRYPLTKMVCNGYAAIGDCAFMTIPLIGSGISNSLRAGQILAEKIVQNNSTDIDVLWEYQKDYYKKIGAEHFMVDSLKRALLDADSEDIRYIFESGILTEEDMLAISNGGLKFKITDVINKLLKVLRKPRFTGSIIKAAIRGLQAQGTAKKIPETYDEKTIYIWQKKCEKYFL